MHNTNLLEEKQVNKQIQNALTNYNLHLQALRRSHYSTSPYMFFSLQNEANSFQRLGILWTFICLCSNCMSYYTTCLQLRIDLFLLPILPLSPLNLKTCFIPLKNGRQFSFLGAINWLGWTFPEIPFHPIPHVVHLQTKHISRW